MSNSNYEVGDIIEYNAFGGELRRVLVESKSENIKNDRPGFDGVLVAAPEDDQWRDVWGYDDQIVRVVTRSNA